MLQTGSLQADILPDLNSLPFRSTPSTNRQIISLTNSLICSFIFYVMASLELIAESIEDPFSLDPDDLPIDKIGENIRKHVSELIH